MKKTQGNWDSSDRNIYFAAILEPQLDYYLPLYRNLLVAVNEIKSPKYRAIMSDAMESGANILIDSGIYNLTQVHAKKHGVSMDIALSTAPDNIDGFDSLFALYVDIITELGNKAWGYIELDQGGRENKIKTRKKLERMGFNPIPVYHPINDGWDYFDELASNYDRICVGNLVQANNEVRKRIICTVYERSRKYPNLWIHLLGVTAHPFLYAFPVGSCDSSSLNEGLRWGLTTFETASALQPTSSLGKRFVYNRSYEPDEPGGGHDANRIGGYTSEFMVRNWRGLLNAYKQEGLL